MTRAESTLQKMGINTAKRPAVRVIACEKKAESVLERMGLRTSRTVNNSKKADTGKMEFESILTGARSAAKAAYQEFAEKHYRQYNFAVCEHENVLDDSSPIKQAWGMYDVCGFVWIEFSRKNSPAIIAGFKKYGKTSEKKKFQIGETKMVMRLKNRWTQGCTLYVPEVRYGNGAMGAMEAAGRAFCEYWNTKTGDDLYCGSRID